MMSAEVEASAVFPRTTPPHSARSNKILLCFREGLEFVLGKSRATLKAGFMVVSLEMLALRVRSYGWK
jgi:hypothetical protein